MSLRHSGLDPESSNNQYRRVLRATGYRSSPVRRRYCLYAGSIKKMRLTPEQAAIIKQSAVRFFGTDVSVLLFGSRADDSKRGGDIDLYIETSKQDVAEIVRAEIAFLADVKMRLGEQKIDVLVNYPSRKMHPPIFEIARQHGVPL